MAADQQMKVLFVLDEFPSPSAGGTEAQFWLLVSALKKDGHRVKVASLRPSGYLASHLKASEYEPLNISRLSSLFTIVKIVKFSIKVRLQGYRIAHLYLNDVSVVMPMILRLTGIRVIVSRRDLGFWYTRTLLKILRINARFVSKVVANCDAVKQAVVKAEGYPIKKVDVILNGCEKPSDSLACKGETLRTQFGIPQGAILIGMVANLRPLKRINDAIQAISLLPDCGHEVWLLVVGEDRHESGRSVRESLETLAASLGVGGRVRFLGSLASSWEFLSQIDLFLSCSETEGLSNSIIEAMMMGVSVIGSKVGGTPELIDHGSTGYLYPVGDVEELRDLMAGLIKNPELRLSMGVEASLFAERCLSVNALRTRHLSLYSEVSGRGVN